MATEYYTGQVQGLSKIATGTPSAFCRAVLSGTLRRSANNIRKPGTGGQLHVRKGTDEVTLECVVVGPAKTDVALWFPTAVGAQVASFPDFLVEADDGSGGQEFVLSGGQPGTVSIDVSGGLDSEVEYTLTMKFTTATEQARGTDVPVYSAFLGHTLGDITVQYNSTEYGVTTFSLSNDLGTEAANTMDTRSSTAHTIPTAYVVTQNAPVLTLGTTNLLMAASMDGDTWTGQDITIAMDNGTSAQNIDIECDEFVPEDWGMPLETDALAITATTWGPGDGTLYNRVKIT